MNPKRRALVNEVAFRVWLKTLDWRWGAEVPDSLVQEVAESTIETSSRFASRGARRVTRLGPEEINECLSLLARLGLYFARVSGGRKIQLFPKFSGCGILDTSAGDVLVHDTLFEIKAGDRTFRSVDVRQLLVYVALNRQAKGTEFKRVGLFNPRTGVSFTCGLDELSFEISGRPADDLLFEVVRIASSGDISR